MMEENSQDLFEIRLNDTGIFYIRKAFRLSGFILVVLTVISTLSTFINIYWAVKNSKLDIADRWGFFQVNIISWLYPVVSIVNFIAVFYYLRFFRSLQRSIDDRDTAQFNKAFMFICRNAVVFIFVLMVELVIVLANLITVIKYL